jgi:hypothetical protein
MNCKSVIIQLVFLFGIILPGQAQRSKKRDKFPSYFGFQYKPLFAGDFLGTSTTTLSEGTLTAVVKQKFGYSFGASVRVGLTRLVSLETGINLVQRNYNVDYDYPDSSLTAHGRLSMLNYDIPLNGLVYIQLGEALFMNTSLGVSAVYRPSNVFDTTLVEPYDLFALEGRRTSKVGLEMNANVGFEYRTESSGIFYIGISGRVPFKPIYEIAGIYQSGSTKVAAFGQLTGTYLSLDFRYFFPNTRNRGTQFMQGPIEQ